jgi:hypothetical protein
MAQYSRMTPLDAHAAGAGTFSVVDYGAIPDDGGDDLPGIQAAIAAASSGDTVYLPCGAYNLSGSMIPKSGQRILGAGRDCTVLQYVGGSLNSLIKLQSSGGNTNVELTGFTLDGMNSVMAGQGIEASGGGGHNLHDLRIRNFVASAAFGPHGIYCSGGVVNCRIANGDFANIGTNSAWGAAVRLSWGSTGAQVISNTINGTGRGGIFLDSQSTDAVIRGNLITNSGVSGPGLGIEVWGGCDRALIEDNVLDHWLSLDGSSHVAVRRNRVSDHSGVVKYIGLELASHGTNVVFADNVVDGGAHIGWSVSGGGAKGNVLFLRNTIRRCETWGAQLQGEGGGATDFLHYDSAFELTRNTQSIYPNQGHGFRVNGGTRNCAWVQCRFNTNAGLGMQWRTDDSVSLAINRFTLVNGGFTNNVFDALPYWEAPSISDIFANGNIASGNGNNALPATMGFASNATPSLSLLVPPVIYAGVPASFGSTFTDDGALARQLWDFGIGLPRGETNPVVTYAAPGNYTIFCAAWDDGGRPAWAQTNITVVVPVISLGVGASGTGFSDGQFGFNIYAPSGARVIVFASANLQNWAPLATNVLGQATNLFTDISAVGSATRFYRVQLAP